MRKQLPADKKRINFKKRSARNRRKIQKTAKRLIEEGSVVVLINEEVPDSAIAVLGKGFGFVPTPTLNIEDTRLDMRLTTNRILTNAKLPARNESAPYPDNNGKLSKLYRKHYGPKSPTPKIAINDITAAMAQDLDSKLRRKKFLKAKTSNLSKDELNGLKWLEKKTKDNQICVVEADKGGAILILPRTIEEKRP